MQLVGTGSLTKKKYLRKFCEKTKVKSQKREGCEAHKPKWGTYSLKSEVASRPRSTSTTREAMDVIKLIFL